MNRLISCLFESQCIALAYIISSSMHVMKELANATAILVPIALPWVWRNCFHRIGKNFPLRMRPIAIKSSRYWDGTEGLLLLCILSQFPPVVVCLYTNF